MPKNAVITGYIPVLHSGYLKFFDAYPDVDTIYVFGPDILARQDYLGKDIRAFTPEQQANVLGNLGRFKTVKTVDAAAFPDIAKQHKLVMPDEDVSHSAAELYPDGDYEYYPVFLRWDRRAAEKQDPVTPDRTISDKELDKELMGLATETASQSSNIWRRVGAVIARDGKIISKSSNRQQPTDFSNSIDGDPRSLSNKGTDIGFTADMHAEARLIAQAARDGVPLKGASIYVDTFPCPPCAKLIANAEFATCYYAKGYSVLDGEELIKSAGTRIIRVDVPENPGHPAEWVLYKKKSSS